MEVKKIMGKGYDSNVYLIEEDVKLLIDSGTGRNYDKIRNELEEYGTSPEDLDILVNTHCHFDHAGGDRDFLEASDCKLLASEFAAEALENTDADITLTGMFGSEMEPLEVSRTIGEGDEIDLDEISLKVLETPGHTKGSISLYEPGEMILFSGDSVFKGGVGRTDLPSSDPSALEKTLNRLAGLEIEKLYPGHGPMAEHDGGKYIENNMRSYT